MPRADKKSQIMQAAERLFTSRRFHEITVDDVAQAAGVGKGTIYRYFRDKDDLFFQTATAGFDDLCRLLETCVPDEGATLDRLTRACAQVSAFYQRRKQTFGMIQSEDGRKSWCRGSMRRMWRERGERLVSAFAQIIRRGAERGDIRTDVAPDVLAAFLLGMLRTRARDLQGRPEAVDDRMLVNLFCHGVALADGGPTVQRPALEAMA